MDLCLDAKLETFRKAIEDYNAIVNHDPLREEETPFLPFIGNQYIEIHIYMYMYNIALVL